MKRSKKDKRFLIKIVVSIIFLMGCARVNIESKKPIKLDVTMRLDIYQHVNQDAQAIENMISTPKEEKSTASNKTSFLSLGLVEAYAQQEQESSYPASVKEAIDRRKERRQDLVSWEAKGAIGENGIGLVEVRDAALATSEAQSLAKDENNDRNMIYQYIAQKNGVSPEETGKIFAKRIQQDVPSGTPIEPSAGQWMKK